ncbi:MAG: DUF2339 domain-containing protein, partial [Chthoniobacterales bacterium]
MEAFFTCGFVGVLIFAIIAVAALFTQRARQRTLQSTVEKLAQRLAILEARGVPAARSELQPIAPQPAPQPVGRAAATPPPLPVVSAPVTSAAPPLAKPAPSKPLLPAIDWEALMGVKLLAWLGGFVLFLGVVFLVQYSFQNNLITPVMRVVIGVVIGLGLIAAGWFTAVRNYRAPGQSLCATGVLVLYADIFAAHAFYDLLALPLTFALMSAITLVAFLLAVILDSQVVVVLGLLGGFLTPPLLMRGPDNALFLFGYVALLNFGVAAVVLRKTWDYLLLLAAIGSVLTELNWLPLGSAHAGFAANGFFIFLALQVQFLAFAILRQRQMPTEKWSTPAALATGFASLGFGFWLLSDFALATRPGFFFGFIFLA